MRLVPGLVWAGSIAGVAGLASLVVPLLGAPVLAIVLGVAVSSAREPGEAARPGVAFASTMFLQLAIVLLGATLRLGEIVHVGVRSLPVLLGTLAVALAGAFALGRALAVPPSLRTLVGVGTGICGASAIVAVAAVIEATAAETAFAISTVFVFNVVAVLAFPPLGHLLHLSQHGFGLWAGTAVNDTSSVVAAAFAYGHSAGTQAVVVKLTRTTMLVPIVLALAAYHGRGERARPRRLVPWFLVGFVLASGAASAGLVGPGASRALSDTALTLITVALAAVGLAAGGGRVRAHGVRPLLLGALLWVAVAATSLALQTLAGQL